MFRVANLRDEMEDGARMENAKQLLGAYRLLLTAELLFEPPPAGVDAATYQVRLRVFGGPAASAGRPLLLPKLNDLDFRELRRLLHLSTRLMVRLMVRALSDPRLINVIGLNAAVKRLEDQYRALRPEGGATGPGPMGVLTRLCNAYTQMFSGHTKETVDEGSVGWKLFARLWGAVEGEDGEEHMRDLFEDEEGEEGEARQQALRHAHATRHQLTDRESLLAMELSHLLKGEHERQDKQKHVARVLKDWALHAGVDLFATPGEGSEYDQDDTSVGPAPAGDAGSDDIKARREWAVWGLAQREAKAARTRDAGECASPSPNSHH